VTRVAVVDDDRLIRNALQRVLLRHGYTVDFLPVNLQAVPLSIDVVICDYSLNGTTALDLMPALLKTSGVVALTGYLDTHLVRDLAEAGADAIVEKPWVVQYDAQGKKIASDNTLVAAIEIAARKSYRRKRILELTGKLHAAMRPEPGATIELDTIMRAEAALWSFVRGEV
jgi:CheY-like chemotaxis protein